MIRAWWTVIISIILLISGCGLLFSYRTLTSVSAEELCDDWNTMSGDFGSYDPGDSITIIDEIYDIQYVQIHPLTGEPISWTQITFKSVGLKIDDINELGMQPTKFWGYIIFNGDLTDDFKIGDKVEVQVEIVTIEVLGQTLEILDWAKELEMVVFDPEELDKDSYAELTVGNHGDISQSNLYPELMFTGITIIGLILLIYGVVSVKRRREMLRMKIETERTTERPVVHRSRSDRKEFKDSFDFTQGDDKFVDEYSIVTPKEIAARRPGQHVIDQEPTYSSVKSADDKFDDEYSIVTPKEIAARRPRQHVIEQEPTYPSVKSSDDDFEDYSSRRSAAEPVHEERRYRQALRVDFAVEDDEDESESKEVTFKRVSRPISYDKYYSTYRPGKSVKRGAVSEKPQVQKPLTEIKWSESDGKASEEVIFKPISRPMSHKSYFSKIEQDRPTGPDDRKPLKSSYLGKTKSQPTEVRKSRSTRTKFSSRTSSRGFGRKIDRELYEDADDEELSAEVVPLEVYPTGRKTYKKKSKHKILCPKCQNVMFITVPYKPFKCYCERCGTLGIIE